MSVLHLVCQRYVAHLRLDIVPQLRRRLEEAVTEADVVLQEQAGQLTHILRHLVNIRRPQ